MKIKINKATRSLSLRSRKAAHAVRIIKLVKSNPRRKGSIGHKSFALLKSGMTYEDYVASGGRNKDLAWDVDHGYVVVEKITKK